MNELNNSCQAYTELAAKYGWNFSGLKKSERNINKLKVLTTHE